MAFDVLRFRGADTTAKPLRERLAALETAYLMAKNPHLGLAEAHTADEAPFHDRRGGFQHHRRERGRQADRLGE